MAATVLAIVAQAASEMGLPVPTQLAASPIAQNRQLFAHANSSGLFLLRAHSWGALTGLGTFTTVNGTSDYAAAADFDRMIPDTEWDRTTHWKVIGAISPQEDRRWRESAVVPPGLWRRFRQLGTSQIRVTPTPTDSGSTLVYEYVSNLWAASGGGTPQAAFVGDTDTCKFDFDLMVKQVKLTFAAAKGLSTAAVFDADRTRLLDQRIGADIGGASLRMDDSGPTSELPGEGPNWNVVAT